MRSLSLRAAFAVLALTVLVLSVLTVALPHDPYIRYQSLKGTIFDRVSWIYERIHFDETPVDVVFVGSSRTARGMVPPKIEAALEARGQDLRVLNLSIPASGLDIRETLLREALEGKTVKLIYISLVEAFPRDGHQAFGELGRVSEVLSSPWIVNRNLPVNLARLPVRQMKLALASQFPEGFGYRPAFVPESYPGSTIDGRFFNEGFSLAADAAIVARPGHEAALSEETERRKREITWPILPDNLSWIEFGVSRTYVARMAALAEEHGAELAFLFLPFYEGFETPIEAEWVTEFGPLYRADFMMAAPENYIDAAHASSRGSDLLAPWIADITVELLERAE